MGAHPLHAATMREAIASNDLAKMKAVLEQAKGTIREQADLLVALVELEEAIQKLK
ncbi:MAG: DUF1843 domain-containing protein [Crocinitomicaceae bacterium]|nr:DUF1843 domain-containing protein [Crocinitomicaceae bacterium]